MKLDALLRKVRSRGSVRGRRSPPPEPAPLARVLRRKRKPRDKFAHVQCAVDAAAPALRPAPLLRPLRRAAPRALRLQADNMRLLRLIRDNHFTRGRVDCRWRVPPAPKRQYHRARVDFCARVAADNRRLHRLFTAAKPRLPTTAELERRWAAARRARVPGALAAPAPRADAAFDAPPGVFRPRVVMRLRLRGGAALGALRLELFAEACPRTAALFLGLLLASPGYVGTRFYRAIDYLYPAGEAGAARYKLVRVSDAGTLHDLLSLAQEQLESQEELLLVERQVPEAGALWDLGAVRAPAPAAVAAATAALPPPRAAARQPNLQALLSTNELSYELRKILISLVEAGARLAAAGPHYERALAQLAAALQPPRAAARPVVEVITPEEIAQRMSAEAAEEAACAPAGAAPAAAPGRADAFRRAEHLQRFLEAFRAWRVARADAPAPEALGALRELGFEREQAEGALRRTGGSAPAAAAWLLGERGSSVFELVDGLPDGLILQTLLKQPQIQRGLLNTRMLAAFVAMVGQAGSAALWLSSPHGSPLLGQISRTYHSEKYCLAVNQFSERQDAAAAAAAPSTSRQR